MNVDETVKLIQTVSENELASLELKGEELKLSLKREKEMPQIVMVSAPSTDVMSMQVAAVQNGLTGPSTMFPAMMSQGVANPQAIRDMASDVDISSDKVTTFSLVGTFYNAPPPDVALFTQAGDTVRKGQVLRVVEVMELMNEIESEYDSAVEAVLVDSEEVIKYGRLLFCVK